MRTLIKLLAMIPFVGLLGGTFFANRVTPYLFGMPFLLGYCVIWVVITTILMMVIYKLDPKNKEGEAR
ncbi:putative membrane protein [Fictibacillus barbaricus]|uniref:Membrane protein n=2 Tax=Fictibacillus barbaricus TaxID=182136 RepID=A0ABU1U4L5_9BACL|nr:putative membrane protein [Fictibacillus barbaricus]